MIGYTLEEISKHNKKNDCWVILYDNVYDITEFMQHHSGKYFPLQVAGKDGTALFESIHPNKAKTILNSNDFKKKYHKGYVIKNKNNLINNFNYDSEFAKKLNERVEKYFESVKNTPKEKGGRNEKIIVYSKFIIITILTIYSKYKQLKTKQIKYSILYGICMLLIIFNISHGSNHGELIKRYPEWFSNICGKYQLFLGNNNDDWKQWHNVSHHQNTNTSMDGDINRDISIRMHPNFEYKARHKYQHIYSWFFYIFAHIVAFVIENNQYKTYLLYIFLNLIFTKIINYNKKVKFKKIILLKAIFLILYVLLPSTEKGFNLFHIFALSFPIMIILELHGILIPLIIEAITFSLLFTLINHITHDNELAEYNNEGKGCWYKHQLKSTANWSCNNMFITHLLGGINYQNEHHLFQSVHHYHYPAIRKIVKQTCEEYNVKYNEFSNYQSALYSHYKLLKKYSKP